MSKPMWSSAWVRKPEATECRFWLCTCAERGDNDERFFGPLERA